MEISSTMMEVAYQNDVEGKIVPKDQADWTSEEDALSTQNSLALNAIFNGVDPSQFNMILTAKVAKEEWDILRVHF